MSPRPIVNDGEDPFNDINEWIEQSRNGNPLSWIFRTAIKDLEIDGNTFSNKLDKFIHDPIHGIGPCSQERSTFRGNTAKDLRNASPSWNKFLFLMKVAEFKSIKFHITPFTRKGHYFTNSVFIPLEGVNVVDKDLTIDASNLPSRTKPERLSQKKLKEIILSSDETDADLALKEMILNREDKYVDLALDEMTYLIRMTMMKMDINLSEWNSLMNVYMSDLDRVKRSHERNNLASQILFSQSSSWKTLIKFLRFAKVKAIKIEVEAVDENHAVRYYQLGVPIN